MNKLSFIVFLFVGLMLSGQEIKKEIEVKNATVYLRGAKVFGSTSVNLQKGYNQVKIVNLPNDIDERTYKIDLNKSTTLLSVTPGNNYEDILKSNENDSEKVKALKAEQKKIQREIDLLNIQMTSLNGEKSIINSNLLITQNDKISPQDQLIKLTEFYSKRMLEIDNKVYAFNSSKRDFEETLAKINQQISEEIGNKKSQTKTLVLELNAEAASTLDLGISYIVSNAGWIPSYDIRATNVKSPLEIIYKAQIYQKTGQDWKNVKLSVSTYQPMRNQDRPILSPMYVQDYLVQNNIQYKKMAVSEVSNSYQMMDDKESTSNIPVATATENQVSILYELNFNQTIVSQDKYQVVIIEKKNTEATYKYHTVPKLSNSAYLMAFIKDWQNLNFMNGEAQIYFEDNYVGKTMTDSRYVKDEFPVSLGVDERIVVKRIKLEDKNVNVSLSSNRKRTEAYQISIRNNTKNSIEIEILDQVPISKDQKISVKTLDLANGEYDEKLGAILWTKTINSGNTEKINFSYEIKYPKEANLYFSN